MEIILEIILKIIGYFICWKASLYMWDSFKFPAMEYFKGKVDEQTKEEHARTSKVGRFIKKNVMYIALSAVPIFRFWLLTAMWLFMLFFNPEKHSEITEALDREFDKDKEINLKKDDSDII